MQGQEQTAIDQGVTDPVAGTGTTSVDESSTDVVIPPISMKKKTVDGSSENDVSATDYDQIQVLWQKKTMLRGASIFEDAPLSKMELK